MAGRLKILHVVTSLDPGGMENGVVNMVRVLESRGMELNIACLERRGAFAERLPNPSRVEVMGKNGGFSPKAVARLSKEISRIRPDIVHTHNLGPLIYSGLATGFGIRCKVVHGEHSQLTPEELKPRRLRQRRWLYRACAAVHTVSRGIRDELLGLGFPAGLITMVANGADTARFSPGDRRLVRESLDLPVDAIVIGIVGRFGPFKRHEALLQAFERIATANLALHLLIAGGGGSEEAHVIDRAQASPYSGRIRLAGFRQDPVPCYQALDLLAIPSSNEGLSNAALEAMACGVPVLANVGCGHEQIITDGVDGIIADLNDTDRLATEIASLAARPSDLIEYGRRARETVKTRFSLDSMADAYENLYRKSVTRSGH